MIAIAIRPNFDYHFYRQDSDGTWSHKQGTTDITQSIGIDPVTRDQNNKAIRSPMSASMEIGYTSFVGYFYVRPLSLQ